ncbi:hypothetical protein [Phocaeicola coprocola]|jgi:hypothetical protein|uniref:Major fimbrial subunit protein N-terminal domain-containing protein n=1 Tax=Phocaeicola coprocola TaxID=310298 RepID=A0A412GPB8_9BACT|nr:hypothetical protein [Phocaeicola coprocola]RGR96615.1 hypothetical protein DWY20_07420 [Phocaeicola coprocola]
MKTSIIHSIVVCLAAFALPFMVACSSREESLPEEISEAILYLNIEPVGLTRAGTATLPDNEKMHSVRVIVLHENGTVEHNKFYSLDGAQVQRAILLKVTPDEKKKIYLFANEESVSAVEGVADVNSTLSAFFHTYVEGMSGFEDAVNGLYFAPDYSAGKPIPMSSMYEIDFPEKGNFDGVFYVVRVATKFTVNFKNWRGEEVTVENFTIASHADRNFLMAHVSSYPKILNLETNQPYPTWIDWLKAVSDASNEDSDAATNRFGWLTDYRLPEQTTAKVYTHEGLKIGKPTVDIDYPDNSKPGVASDVPVFYLPESKNLKAGATEQEYILTIKIAGRAEPFVCKLDKLKALFRNTHLVVNITMYNSNEIVVDVIPYSEVNLEPEFGL